MLAVLAILTICAGPIAVDEIAAAAAGAIAPVRARQTMGSWVARAINAGGLTARSAGGREHAGAPRKAGIISRRCAHSPRAARALAARPATGAAWARREAAPHATFHANISIVRAENRGAPIGSVHPVSGVACAKRAILDDQPRAMVAIQRNIIAISFGHVIGRDGEAPQRGRCDDILAAHRDLFAAAAGKDNIGGGAAAARPIVA